MKYRRIFMPGATFFFTLVTYHRQPILCDTETIEILRGAFRYTLARMPFTINASVILPDHMHFIWTLPPESGHYSTRWRLIKSHFTHHFQGAGTISQSTSRQHKGERDVWQRRFWEHLIRDEDDLSNHVEYIHYNPVKHGLATSAAEWKYSSFMQYVQSGFYPVDWASDEKIFAGSPDME